MNGCMIKDTERPHAKLTSIGVFLLALPLLAARGVGARRPVGIELHVQLTLTTRQLVVLGLLVPAQRVPLQAQHIRR